MSARISRLVKQLERVALQAVAHGLLDLDAALDLRFEFGRVFAIGVSSVDLGLIKGKVGMVQAGIDIRAALRAHADAAAGIRRERGSTDHYRPRDRRADAFGHGHGVGRGFGMADNDEFVAAEPHANVIGAEAFVHGLADMA